MNSCMITDLMAILDVISDAVIGLGKNGSIRLANCAVRKMWGYEPDEVVGMRVSDLLEHNPKSFCRNCVPKVNFEIVKRALSDRPTRMVGKKPDGSRFPVDVSLNLIDEAGGIGFVCVVRDATQAEQREQETKLLLLNLKDAQRERYHLAHRVLAEREREARRIALEIHDDLGARLTVLKMLLCTGDGDVGVVGLPLDDIIGEVEGITDAVRRFSRELRPAALDDFGLVDALVVLGNNFNKTSGVAISTEFFDVRGGDRFDTQVETAIYRIAQEALTNVTKHAQASTVALKLYRRTDTLLVSVVDDGNGFDTDVETGARLLTVGLSGMRDRAILLGGTLKVVSENDNGTWIVAELPVSGVAI